MAKDLKDISSKTRVMELLIFPDLDQESFPILGKDYDAEMIVNSEGNYIWRCFCSTSTFGNLESITMLNPYITCGSCYHKIPAHHFTRTGTGRRGPRIYGLKRYQNEEELSGTFFEKRE